MSKFLIHVGYPKSGSCFLGEWFRLHPAFVSNGFKLAGLESTSDLCKLAVSMGDEVKYFVIKDMIFSCPIVNEVVGVADINEYQEKVCKILFDLFPNSKILIVTRGFQSAITSTYFQYVKEGGVYSLNELTEKYKNSNWIPYNYSFLINLYNQYFGKENVIVVPFELLKESPKKFLNYIENKLEVTDYDFEIGEINASVTPEMLYAQRKLNIAVHKFSNITGKFGKYILKLYLKNLNAKKTSSKNNFFLVKLMSIFLNKKTENTSIPPGFLLKTNEFGTALKEYAIFEKYDEKYLIKK